MRTVAGAVLAPASALLAQVAWLNFQCNVETGVGHNLRMARFLAFLKFAAVPNWNFAAVPNWNFVGQALGPEVGICAGICGIVFPYPPFVELDR